MKNQFGNYVIQKALKVAVGYQKMRLINNIKKNLDKIADYKLHLKWNMLISQNAANNQTAINNQAPTFLIPHMTHSSDSVCSTNSSNSNKSNYLNLRNLEKDSSPQSFGNITNTSNSIKSNFYPRNFDESSPISFVNITSNVNMRNNVFSKRIFKSNIDNIFID